MPLLIKPTPGTVLLFAVSLLGVALVAGAWRSARHDSQQLAAVLAAQNNAIQQASDREKQRDVQLTAALAAIQAQKRDVHTPQQAASQLADVLPALPLPVFIRTPNLSTPSPPGESAAAEIAIPELDLLPLYNGLQDCRASTLRNETLQKDLADEKSISAALRRERDAAETVSHGGRFFTRLKRAAKWFAIGAAAGAAIAGAIRH
jgi:hypothetical protein